MNKFIALILAAAGSVLVALHAPVYAQDKPSATRTEKSAGAAKEDAKVSRKDAGFMRAIAVNGLTEVEVSKLATSQASSDQVKKFAQQMIDDHTKANQELQQLASSKGVKLPTEPDAKHKRMLKDLQGLSGEKFDQRYMGDAGLKAHKEALSVLQDTQKNAQDPDLKAFAAKTLPVVTKHHEMAQQIAPAKGAHTGANRDSKDSK